jgi:hypothetical protein
MAWGAKRLKPIMDTPKRIYLMTLQPYLALPNEEFRDVPKFEGFIAASNMGRIYSYPRSVTKHCGLTNGIVTQRYEGRLLSQYDRGGYMTVRFGINKKKFTELVSRLVLMAFDRHPKDHELACHKDSNPTNNCIGNLRWDNQTGNMKDRTFRGLYKRGEDHHAATIPVELVDRLQAGLISPSAAAKQYGYRYAHLWRIAKGHCWKHRLVVFLQQHREIPNAYF